MRPVHILALALPGLVAALSCETAPSVFSDPGTGTNTLVVAGGFDVDTDAGATNVSFTIRHDGLAVNDAVLQVFGDVGPKRAGRGITIARSGSGTYAAALADSADSQWTKASSYHLVITADGGAVEATVLVPELPRLLEPNASGFDPHAAPSSQVTIRWAGAAADLVSCKTTGYSFPLQTDPLSVLVPANVFTEPAQEIAIERENVLELAGGAAGSQMTAHSRTNTTVTVNNPFSK